MALSSVAKAAEEMGVSRSTLYAMAREKSVPGFVRIGDRVLVDVAKVIAALEIQPDSTARPLLVGGRDRRQSDETKQVRGGSGH